MKQKNLERASSWLMSNFQNNLKILFSHQHSLLKGLSLVILTLLIPLEMSAQCEPDIAGIESELPDAVTITTTAKPGVDSYFTITIDGSSSIAGQGIPAWCADQDLSLENDETHNFDVYSSYETLPSGAFEKPENFDLVNWLLNQDFVGTQSLNGLGEYTFGHVQYAIWLLIDDSVCVQCIYLTQGAVEGDWNTVDPNDVAKAEELAAAAEANGDGFVPGCGELLAIALIPADRQSLIITKEVPPLECVTECVIVATDEAKIHSDNTVSGGDVCENPSEDVIPTFYANTVSDGDRPDLKVEAEEGCVTTDVEVFDKVEVKEGGCLIFTGKNIFIKELKVEKHTSIKFEDCANVFITKDIRFEDFTTFNPDMYDVTLYVDDNVEVKKGSNISAHIYALGHDIKAEGKEDSPTTMKGVFAAKKVEGKDYVNWIGNAYCDPCPPEFPEPIPSCECEGGMTSVTFSFAGDLGDLSTNSGSISENGDGTFTVAVNPGQDKLEKDLKINGAEIHTSCSQDILGVTFSGGITVVGYIDTKGNITSVDGCGQLPPGPDCECDGGIVSVTFTYEGTLPILSSDDNNAAFTDNGDGTVTLATFDGGKLSNPDIFVNAVNEGELHASCSQNLLGKMYGVLTVISYIDAEGGEISLANCPADPVECDCSGGLKSITLAYTGAGSLSTNSGSITDNNNGTFTISTSDKLEKDLEISVNGVVEAIVHTSCSDDILGNVNASKSSFGDSGAFPDPVEGDNNGTFLVISHTDTNGNVCSIDYTPSFRTSMRTMEEAKPVISEFRVKAWPNPTINQFNIKVLSPDLTDKVKLEVFDMRGRVIHKAQFNTGYDYKFGDNLNAGLYFVRLQQGDSVETIKLMKQ